MADELLPGRSDDPEVQRALDELARRTRKRDAIAVTGSRGGGAALVSLLAALDAAGIIDDQTTA